MDVPGGDRNRLKRYWLVGPGAARWATWTELYRHLLRYMGDNMARRCASEWFHDRYGIWSGERKGRNPLGPG